MARQDLLTGVLLLALAVMLSCCRLYRHLGRVTHVVVPWEHTWTFMAKCVGADVARVTAWAIVGSMVFAGGLLRLICIVQGVCSSVCARRQYVPEEPAVLLHQPDFLLRYQYEALGCLVRPLPSPTLMCATCMLLRRCQPGGRHRPPAH